MISFFCALCTKVCSQDVLLLKNGDRIKCTIIEIFEDRISYLELNDDSEILYTISRAKLDSIRLSNGKIIQEVAPTLDDNIFYNDKKRCIKFDFFSMLSDVIIISYEQATGPFTSFEISPKFFGYGTSNRSVKGFGIDGAYKMKISAVLNKPDLPDHLLHGGYGKLSGGIAYTQESKFNFISATGYHEKQTVIHLGIDFGKQWVLRNLVSLDLYFGLHYYYDHLESTGSGNFPTYFEDINHGNLFGDNNFAALLGFRIGLLFDRNKNQKRI